MCVYIYIYLVAISRIVTSWYRNDEIETFRRQPLPPLKGFYPKPWNARRISDHVAHPPLLLPARTFVLHGLSTDLRPTIRRYREPPTYKIYFCLVWVTHTIMVDYIYIYKIAIIIWSNWENSRGKYYLEIFQSR